MTLRRFQSKFKHLWDAAERSVRSAEAVDKPSAHQWTQPETDPGPLEQAISAQQAEIAVGTATESNEAVSGAQSQQDSNLQSKKSGMRDKQGSTAMGLTGRLSSLFFTRQSTAAEYPQHEDDLSGSSYMYRDY